MTDPTTHVIMRQRLRVVPLTLPTANSLVERWHRHHGALPGGFAWWAVGVCDESGAVVGVAIAGRPTNRNNDDAQTVEVLRLATDGTANACSALLGACARASAAIGAWRVITYTLTTETGASLRGAGWVCEDENTGRSWWTTPGTRAPARERPHMHIPKQRWAKILGSPITVSLPVEEVDSRQQVLPL